MAKEHFGNGSAVGREREAALAGTLHLAGHSEESWMSSEGLHSAKPLLCCETTPSVPLLTQREKLLHTGVCFKAISL